MGKRGLQVKLLMGFTPKWTWNRFVHNGRIYSNKEIDYINRFLAITSVVSYFSSGECEVIS